MARKKIMRGQKVQGQQQECGDEDFTQMGLGRSTLMVKICTWRMNEPLFCNQMHTRCWDEDQNFSLQAWEGRITSGHGPPHGSAAFGGCSGGSAVSRCSGRR